MGVGESSISDAELDVLKVLWKVGPASVRDIHAKLNRRKKRWAYNTVATLLGRLRDKGFVSHKKEGIAYIYSADVSREQLLSFRLSDLAERVCDGTAGPLVHALMQGTKLSPEEISELRKMIDELDAS
ncbi:MAG: BlaI/MecI/CopY family transcriptional regulator [Planctomycetaceae bacterium]